MRTREPIFDQLVEESPSAPICTICGNVWMGRDTVCSNCWMCNRADEPEMWHCSDCGVFLEPFDRFVLVTAIRTDGYIDNVFLCREHYEAREHESAV